MQQSFSLEVNSAFKTPKQSLDHNRKSFEYGKHTAAVENEPTEPHTPIVLDNRIVGGQNNTPRGRFAQSIIVNNIPCTPPDEILSPQPRQCVKKILQLTGQVGPLTTPSSAPTLHNSSQKIRQMTGLDVGPHEFQHDKDDASPISPCSSTHSRMDGLEETISEPDLNGYMQNLEHHSFPSSFPNHSVQDLRSPLQTPNFNATSTRPISLVPLSPTTTPPAAFQRKSSSIYSYGGEAALGIKSRPADDPYHRNSWLSATDSWTSSRESSHVGEMYHSASAEVARHSPSPRQLARDNRPGHNVQPQPPRQSGLNFSLPHRTKESFTDRKVMSSARIPTPLQTGRDAPKPAPGSTYTQPKRTPYPPVANMSAFDEDDDKRSSILSKIFSKRDSSAFSSPVKERGVVSGKVRKMISGPDTRVFSAQPVEKERRKTKDHFNGLLAHAKQVAGFRSKDSEAEKRRSDLRKTIRVVSEEQQPRPFA